MERFKVELGFVEGSRKEKVEEEEVRLGGVTAYDCFGYQWVVGCSSVFIPVGRAGFNSIEWRFLGPSINLDHELRKRLRCGAAPGPWTPA